MPFGPPARSENVSCLPILEAFRSYFVIADDAPTRARLATDSIASTILE
jgi:hypothetical protein